MTVYGPSNPHPLSRMKTELVWEGKYDEFGDRREVNVARLAMPLKPSMSRARARIVNTSSLMMQKLTLTTTETILRGATINSSRLRC